MVLLVVTGIASYYVASNNAAQAFDRSLLNMALALANQVHVQAGELRFDLQPQARQILLTDRYDEIRYAVYGPGGGLISGDGSVLPERGLGSEEFEDDHLFFDSVVDTKAVRGVVLRTSTGGGEVTAVVTETLVKREMQVGEILINILLPETILLAVTIMFVLHGVDTGLQPLEDLRRKLAQRAPTDLTHIATGNEPLELRPLVREIDHHLDRLGTALDAQRHFVSDAAHQLRTPIAALLAQLESVRIESGDARLDPALASTRRFGRLVNQLLALARAEPGGMPTEPVDLRTLVEAEAGIWLEAALARDIDLGFELGRATVDGIALLLREMIGNLVDNAIRYTPIGGRVTVRVGCDRRGRFVAVDDSGPGVPPAQRERVFERLFRGDGVAAGGSGLGLAIVRQIAGQHGASVAVGQSADGGASFVVRFPYPPDV